MMQPCASAAKLRGGGPILPCGMKAIEPRRDPATSNRHRQPSQADFAETVGVFNALLLLRWAQNYAIRHYALSHKPPQGNQQLARQGHDHELASPAGVLGAGSKPLRQTAVFLEHEKSPGQLHHA